MKLNLFYLITFTSQPRLAYFVQPGIVEIGKKQSHNKPQFFSDLSQITPSLFDMHDQDIFELLAEIQSDHTFPLMGQKGAILLENLIDSGRAHFSSHCTPPLTRGKTQHGKLSWVDEPDGKQRLHCWISGGASTILPLQPLWYINHFSHKAGELETSLNPDIAVTMLFAPSMRPEKIREIYTLLKTVHSEKEIHQTLKVHLEKIMMPVQEKNIDTWYCDWKAVSSQKHWFDFEIGIEYEGDKINLLPILAELVQSQLAIYSLESLLRLPDDKIFIVNILPHRELAIPMSRLRKILGILTELYEEDALFGNEKLRISSLRALQFAQLKEALETKNLKWHGDTSLQNLIKKFETFKKNQFSVLPKDFSGELRHYQAAGIHWLQFLRETGFSGILADDMGLGKTVQVLAHLLIEKHKKSQKYPSLIIAPTSLLMNWQREAAQFTPRLRVLILHGQSRKALFNQIPDYDVVITTYSLLVRDEEILPKYKYHILVLEEAQNIKNSYSKAGRAARRLSAEQRLCLTGTPMENHLGELWSLFHFLLPGLLGEKKQFHQLFRFPIEKNQDTGRLEVLKQRIAPFFLRRIKQEVLPELPEKIEMVRPVLLTDIQREVYENIRIALHQKVLLAIQAQGIARSQIYILSALLKLRQVCCDPRLLKSDTEDYTETASAKLQLLIELLPTLILRGRRILLFSQFTEMLTLIEATLKNLGIKYLKLTGKTQNRDKLIQKFQAGEAPLFLISLKAGGVGVNLTKADTVIHYDPWWNPAVENQATDRAHRIGQDKTVFVYKFITSGTIEEKIMALQQEKKSLFEAILSGNQKVLEQFSTKDIEKLFTPLE
jgi:SNF2 family DNA or RNA helicase